MKNYIEYYIQEGDGQGYSIKAKELTIDEAVDYQTKYKVLSRKFEIENIFDVFIEEFKRFKGILYESQLSQEMDSHSGLSANIEDHRTRTKLNVSYLGVLNTGKLLLDRLYYENKEGDSVSSIIKEIDKSVLAAFKKVRDRVFVNNNFYAFACKYRNLCQHKLLPINLLIIYENLNKKISKFSIPLELNSLRTKDRRELFSKLNTDFKESIKRERRIDLNRVIDGYFEGIFDLMIGLRELVKSAVNEAESFLNNNDDNIGKQVKKPVLYIDKKEVFNFNLEWFEVAHFLERKNSTYFKSSQVTRTQYIEEPKT